MVALLSPRVHPWMRRLSLGRERKRYKDSKNFEMSHLAQDLRVFMFFLFWLVGKGIVVGTCWHFEMTH